MYKILLLERIKKIKDGNTDERDRLIQEYIPFIIKTVSNILNGYIETENSEEFIIGLEAFNESIDKYDVSRSGFLTFASIVIKSRIIDYKRKENSNNTFLYLDEFDEYQLPGMNSENEINKYNEELNMQMELNDFKNKLLEFNITLTDLVENSPKHKDTRINAIRIARIIQESPVQKEMMYLKKKLPYSFLVSGLISNRKFLDRNKKFIIATVLLLDSNLDTLKTYIYDAERSAAYDL